MTTSKICTSCNLQLPLDLFHLNGQSADGYNYTCRPCSAVQAKAHMSKAKSTLQERQASVTEKTCRRCQKVKPTSEYGTATRNSDGWAHICRPCNTAEARAKRMETKYGLRPLGYWKLADRQDQSCAICSTPFDKVKQLCVDHDHESGLVRGLLCLNCNGSLGTFGDNIEGLERAIEYLRQPQISSDGENFEEFGE